MDSRGSREFGSSCFSTASLAIQPNDRGSGRVRFVEAGTSRSLGAETLKYIARPLLDFLSDRTLSLGWILSLSGSTRVHARRALLGIGPCCILQDKDANMFAELVIADDEKKQWIQELTRWRRALPESEPQALKPALTRTGLRPS